MVTNGQVGQLWPAFGGPGLQPLPQRGFSRLRWCGHGVHDARTGARRVVAGTGQVSGDKRFMPISSCDQIVLCDGQRRLLLARAGRVSGEHRDVLRARIVLAAADGASNAAIGRALGVCDDTVRKWRRRFCEHGIDGLRDRPRTGRPAGSRRRWWPK